MFYWSNPSGRIQLHIEDDQGGWNNQKVDSLFFVRQFLPNIETTPWANQKYNYLRKNRRCKYHSNPSNYFQLVSVRRLADVLDEEDIFMIIR